MGKIYQNVALPATLPIETNLEPQPMTLVIKANKWPLHNTVPDTTHDFMLFKLPAVLVKQSKEAHYTIILKQHCVAKVFKQLNSDHLLLSDGF